MWYYQSNVTALCIPNLYWLMINKKNKYVYISYAHFVTRNPPNVLLVSRGTTDTESRLIHFNTKNIFKKQRGQTRGSLQQKAHEMACQFYQTKVNVYSCYSEKPSCTCNLHSIFGLLTSIVSSIKILALGQNITAVVYSGQGSVSTTLVLWFVRLKKHIRHTAYKE